MLDLGRDHVVGLHTYAAEETGKDGVAAGDFAGAEGHPVVGDHAQQGTEIEYVPALLAEDGHAGAFALERVALAGDGLDEGGFAAAVGSQDGDVLADADAEAEVVEDDLVAAHDGDVLQFDQGLVRGHC